MVLLAEAIETTPHGSAPSQRARAVAQLAPRGWHTITRRRALLRRALIRSPLVRRWSDRRYDARRERHSPHVPSAAADQRTVLAELSTIGVAVRPADLPAAVVASADGFVEMLSRSNLAGPCVKATPRELAQDPILFAWGLSEHLLDLAECHIGLPVRYLGLEVKREKLQSASGHSHDVVRRWHRDHEDRRILKVIVYLSDTPTGAGPFGYVHQANSGAILESTGGSSLHGMTDDQMDAVVPRSQWKQVIGTRLTAIHVDTGQVFHRVFPPTDLERYSVTFAYSSRSPYMAYSHLMLPRHATRQLREHLSQRQRDALFVGGRRHLAR
jgi:hypothetical protein